MCNYANTRALFFHLFIRVMTQIARDYRTCTSSDGIPLLGWNSHWLLTFGSTSLGRDAFTIWARFALATKAIESFLGKYHFFLCGVVDDSQLSGRHDRWAQLTTLSSFWSGKFPHKIKTSPCNCFIFSWYNVLTMICSTFGHTKTSLWLRFQLELIVLIVSSRGEKLFSGDKLCSIFLSSFSPFSFTLFTLNALLVELRAH